MSPRSRTTWSIDRSVRQWLIARAGLAAADHDDVGGAYVLMGLTPAARRRWSDDLDDDGGRVGDDVEDGRPLLRLGDDGLDLLLGGVGVDLVADRMPLKPLRTSGSMPRMPARSMSPSTVALTERSWMPRFLATEATPAVRQPARPISTISERGQAVVGGGEDLRVVGVDR